VTLTSPPSLRTSVTFNCWMLPSLASAEKVGWSRRCLVSHPAIVNAKTIATATGIPTSLFATSQSTM